MTAVDRDTIERVKTEKRRRRSSPSEYQDRPRLAFIVHSFNRISNIEQLVGGLRGLGEHELIVCEDGSLDGSHEKWMSYLDRPNDFLIHSNDLHEIRILDRAIRFARSDIVCLVQDDDLIPRETDWLEAALGHFAYHPGLAILGGFQGYESFDPDPAKAKPIWGGDQFRFVHFKGPAGHYPADGGTVLFSNDTRVRNAVRNSDTIFEKYGKYTRRIDRLVEDANAGLESSLADPQCGASARQPATRRPPGPLRWPSDGASPVQTSPEGRSGTAG